MQCTGIRAIRHHISWANVIYECICVVTTNRNHARKVVRACVHSWMAWISGRSYRMPNCCWLREWHWFELAYMSTHVYTNTKHTERAKNNKLLIFAACVPCWVWVNGGILTTMSEIIFLATDGVTYQAWFSDKPSRSNMPMPPATCVWGSNAPISNRINDARKISSMEIFDGRQLPIL